ncbi:MAG: C40 family peptidase [Lachnospiraceae bacterium]|nr:C40 family peptidase [Lachnospiraceae bacterium]
MFRSFLFGKKQIAGVLVTAMAALVFLCLHMSAYGAPDNGNDDDTDTTGLEEERDRNQEKLDEVEASLEELAGEKEDVEAQIEEVTEALVEVMADIDELTEQIVAKEAEIAEAQVEYDAAVADENAQYEAMKVRIKYMYEKGDSDYVMLLTQAGSMADFLTKADYIEDLYEYDRNMLATYQETVARVAELQEKLEQEKSTLLSLQSDALAEQEYMEEIQAELEATAAEYASEILAKEGEAAEYEAIIATQNAEIKRRQEEAARRAAEEARRRAEEAARLAAQKAAEEAAQKAAEDAAKQRQEAVDQVADAADTGVVKTTNKVSYDVSSIYSAGGSELGKSLAAYACKFIGNPYVPGGTSLTDGADCSGFVYSVYKDFGYSVPRTSFALRSAGTEVSYENAQPGDVICYPGHVGIYIGNGMIVHASTQKTGIKVSNANYRGFITIRRII